MPEAFSFNREFDFVRPDRLCRTTGRPSHEWDFYIIKELIDNALDADEGHWLKDLHQYPDLKIRIEYTAKQLFVEVRNRSVFPAELIPEIFATQQYTSRKAFVKGLTRGALGNALKTLLGIPYALRNRVANDWNPDQKPLSILCGNCEYLPTYQVDTTKQTIQFECLENPCKQLKGTTIRVALDYFEQEKPRTLAEVKCMAEQYHLCNPHAEFDWAVEMEEEEWSICYEANPSWLTKFRGDAPIQWYSLTAFQDLLGALYRKQNDQQITGLSIALVGSHFKGFEGEGNCSDHQKVLISVIIKEFGQSSLAVEDFEGVGAKKLYQVMGRLSPTFDSLLLGRIGKEYIRATLTEVFPLDGEVVYDIARDTGEEPSIPFVIEAAIAPLQTGTREIRTALNFTPTYDDPFLRRRLFAPIQPDRVVIGLREFLDAYGVDEDTPAVVFFHLVCPNMESGEFSKTEINHLPFKQIMGEVLDRLLRTFNQARENKALQLEKTVFQALDEILDGINEKKQFVLVQLLEKLRMKLSQDPVLAEWLQMPDAMERLQTYLNKYQSQNKILTQRVARPAMGTIVLPIHPDRYFSIQAEHISQDILTRNHVNKILSVQVLELEPVIIENGWLCRMDMALLRTPSRLEALQEALIQCVVGSELPILVLRDGDIQSLEVIEQIRGWLTDRHLDTNRLIDLGWGLMTDSGHAQTRLVGMMPDELEAWVIARLETLNLSTKFLPVSANIRREIGQCFEQLLLSYLWEGVSQRMEMSRLLGELDQQLQFTQMMQTQTLDEQIQRQIREKEGTQSYGAVLDEVVRQFFEQFLRQHSDRVLELTQSHFQQLQGG
jgi:hypothetical protein